MSNQLDRLLDDEPRATAEDVRAWRDMGELFLEDTGQQEWRDRSGLRHRADDLPAVITPAGLRKWYKHGKLHRRDNKPAVINPNGHQAWYVDGQRVRTDGGPTVITAEGKSKWFRADGKLHRLDGPAVESADGFAVEFWVDGVQLADAQAHADAAQAHQAQRRAIR